MTGGRPDLCAAVAAYGLPGTALELSDRALDDAAWAALISCASHERLSGLLAQTVADGAMPTTADQAEKAIIAHRQSMAAAVTLERMLVHTAAQLAEAGIDLRVLKGPAVAHLDYPDASLRAFGDIDLLVRAAQFDSAVKLLVSAGHRRRYPEPRPGFDRRFGKGSCLVSAHGYELDLHRTLALGPYGLALRPDDLWERSSSFSLAGRPLLALGPEERFLHACFHAALGSPVPRLTALRDVAQMLLCRPLDDERILGLSRTWRADAVVARAVTLAWKVLGIRATGALVVWAGAYEPDRRARRTIALYTDPAQTYAAKSFAAVRSISGLRAKLAFVFALLFPRRRYLDRRSEGPICRWRRGVAQVRRSRRRSKKRKFLYPPRKH